MPKVTQKKLKVDYQDLKSKHGGAGSGDVVKKGSLVKFTRGTFGLSKHERFVKLTRNGEISWAKDATAKALTGYVISVRSQGAELSKMKLKQDEMQRFLMVQTTEKSLFFLAENKSVRLSASALCSCL